jgi:hypothetical protein
MSRAKIPTVFKAKFIHRSRVDGSVESICLRCYQTVAASVEQSDRDTQEATHNCEGMRLSGLLHPDAPR